MYFFGYHKELGGVWCFGWLLAVLLSKQYYSIADRLPACLICNRHQWARKGPGARKITCIALWRSWRPPCL